MRRDNRGYSLPPQRVCGPALLVGCDAVGSARCSPMQSYPSAVRLPLILDRTTEPILPVRELFSSANPWAPREVISHRAYAIWQREGFPENRALANWLEAEVQIMGRA